MSIRPLLLGFTVPDDVAAEIYALDPIPPVNTHRFAWSLARSIRSAFGSVTLLSASPVQTYPIVPRAVFRRQEFEQDGIQGVMVGFVNLLLARHITRLYAVLRELPTVFRSWRSNVVFIHGLHTPWLVYGRLLQAGGVTVIPVLTDPSGVVLPSDGVLRRALKGLDRSIVRYFISRASAVAALAPGLIDTYSGEQRSLVFPGILGRDWLQQLEAAGSASPEPGIFTVLYAGRVDAAYGLDRLLDAARLLPDVRFVILGKGDLIPRLVSESLPNVDYRGFVPPADIVPHLLGADVLVNPRPSDEGFAVNSFPSKLLEYAVTGRPVLTTRLRSIPSVIAPCFEYIEDESAEGIARAVRALAARPAAERLSRAAASRELVLREFSEEAIGRKLLSLLSPTADASEDHSCES